MGKCCVSIDDWQIQCCGEPFKVGDTVEWFVKKWDKVMPDYHDAGAMDNFNEHLPTDYSDRIISFSKSTIHKD